MAYQPDEVWAELAHYKALCGELREALEEIAELEGDTEGQKFKLTRFQTAQIARHALYKAKD